MLNVTYIESLAGHTSKEMCCLILGWIVIWNGYFSDNAYYWKNNVAF